MTNNFALKLTAKKFSFFFYPNNFNLKKPIYLLTHTSTHTKIHFLHIVRQFLEHACSIDTYKPYTNSNCITIDFEKNRISNVISFNFQYLSDFFFNFDRVYILFCTNSIQKVGLDLKTQAITCTHMCTLMCS